MLFSENAEAHQLCRPRRQIYGPARRNFAEAVRLGFKDLDGWKWLGSGQTDEHRFLACSGP